MRRWHEERRVEPRFTQRFGGVDHGSKGVVLAEIRRGNEVHRRLVWFEGHKTPVCGIRGFGHVYRPARLNILDRTGLSVDSGMLEGGRLTRARLARIAEAVDAGMGVAVSTDIDPARTLVIVEDAP